MRSARGRAGGAAALARPRSGRTAAAAAARPLDPATAAWLAALPCALLTVLALWLLGPPLGGLLTPSGRGLTFLPVSAAGVFHESTEHARYLLALGTPLLLSLATWRLSGRSVSLSERRLALLVAIAQAATVALLAACVVVQYRLRFGAIYTRIYEISIRERYFTPPTLVAAACVAGVTLAGVRFDRVRTRARAWTQETDRRRWLALGLAVVFTAVWLLHAVNSEESIATAVPSVRYHLQFTLDEAFAVRNGMTPLVDFTPQYSSLWPYLGALALAAFGKTLLVFTLSMCTLTGAALLAIFGVLRRATRSSLAALALYLPVLAMGFFSIGPAAATRATFGTYFGIFPLRYAGPYFVALLTARQLERGATRRSSLLLFAASGLVLLNNTDFGVAALGASVVACLWGSRTPTRRSVAELLGALAGGLLSAFALVSLLTLVRAGSLPHLSRLVEYAHVYGIGGFAMFPLPSPLGLHLAIYVTYVAAIAVATVRALRGAENRVLTGMLAWSGVFGLGAASYYVGRAQPEALRTTFSAWALAMALLTYVAIRQLAARPRARPALASVALLVGFGIAVTCLAQTPLPWSQVERVADGFVAGAGSRYRHPLQAPEDPSVRAFVASVADGPRRFVFVRGAPVAVLVATGHRIADAYGIRDVSPYTGTESIHTVQQVDAVADALRAAGGNTVVLPSVTEEGGPGIEGQMPLDLGIVAELARRGFELVTPRGLAPYQPSVGLRHATVAPMPAQPLIKMVDTRHLHPRTLR